MLQSHQILADFTSGHAENRAVQEDIFAPRQFRMKAGAHFEQAGDPAAQH